MWVGVGEWNPLETKATRYTENYYGGVSFTRKRGRDNNRGGSVCATITAI